MTEHLNEGRSHEHADGWWLYDAVPRDGPALYVVLADTWDRGDVTGLWIRPDSPTECVVELLSSLTDRQLTLDDLRVVDQVGLGQAMVDELWLQNS
jgi:hypothetical protein